jgi:hypothetical protein
MADRALPFSLNLSSDGKSGFTLIIDTIEYFLDDQLLLDDFMHFRLSLLVVVLVELRDGGAEARIIGGGEGGLLLIGLVFINLMRFLEEFQLGAR